MSYTNSTRAQTLSRSVVALAALIAFATPFGTASAQIGRLVKKAADKAVDKPVDNTAATSGPGAAPKFDDVTLELTNDRLSQIIRGLSAGRAVLDGPPSRAQLVTRRDAAANQSAALSQGNTKAIEAYNQKHFEAERCRNDAIHASREKNQKIADERQKELQSKAMTDPAFREKAMAIAQKMAAAQQRGDTAEMRRLAAQLSGAPLADDKTDSLAADKACGPLPPKPAAFAQIEQLDAQSNTLSDQIRKLEEKSQATEVKESGMNDRQFMMARERVEAYLSAMKYKSQPRGFSATELQALGARRADLEKAM
jgi:hypothetical protein